MRYYLSSNKKFINLIKYFHLFFIFFVIAMGIIFIVASGGGDGGRDEESEVSEEVENNADNDLINECGIDYDLNPGCDDSDEACSMAMRINIDRKTFPDESDCAPAIKWSEELAAVALAHSQNMCDQRELAHVMDGKNPFDRMADAGIEFVTAGENVAMGNDIAYDLNDIEDSFMKEEECEYNHRRNILNRDFTHVGIGIVHCDDGNQYITQDFATFNFDDIRNDPNEYCEY
ncbi:MAG: hypothetical protein JW944_10440 [Deltaproteobacteria bacterium]|nr:hypothetical protein [Deltaproteobacteria bacterium]